MRFLKKIAVGLILAILPILLIVTKLMQSAAHRDEWLDWSYIFSWPNIEKSLIIAGVSVLAVLLYALGRYLMRKHSFDEDEWPDDDFKE